jgi:hypothetical protein
MVLYMLISSNIFKDVNLILPIDLFPVHWLTHVLHHCIAVPLSESKSKVHIIMKQTAFKNHLHEYSSWHYLPDPFFVSYSDHHLLVHTTPTHKRCIHILCDPCPSCKSSINWKNFNCTYIFCSFNSFKDVWEHHFKTVAENWHTKLTKTSYVSDTKLNKTWLPQMSKFHTTRLRISLLATTTMLWISLIINNKIVHPSAFYALDGGFCGALVVDNSAEKVKY